MTVDEKASELTPPAPDGVDTESFYNILGDKRRRYTIHYLKQQGGEVPIGDVAEQVAAWENGKTVEDVTSQERKRVYISLYQSHLPSLDERDVVEYDKDRGTVRLSDRIANQSILIEVVPEGNIPWGLYYLGLVSAAAIVLSLVWQEVAPFHRLSPLVWSGVIVAVFAISAFVQTLQSRGMRLGDEGAPPDWQEIDHRGDSR